jgi:excisionase family DNA binding protein
MEVGQATIKLSKFPQPQLQPDFAWKCRNTLNA